MTKLSLLLKVLEGESEQSVNQQPQALPRARPARPRQQHQVRQQPHRHRLLPGPAGRAVRGRRGAPRQRLRLGQGVPGYLPAQEPGLRRGDRQSAVRPTGVAHRAQTLLRASLQGIPQRCGSLRLLHGAGRGVAPPTRAVQLHRFERLPEDRLRGALAPDLAAARSGRSDCRLRWFGGIRRTRRTPMSAYRSSSGETSRGPCASPWSSRLSSRLFRCMLASQL